jgi:hypothetical protein
MSKRVVVLLMFAIIASRVGLSAQAPAAGKVDGAVSTGAAQSASPASTTLSVRGTIDKFDPSTRILSLSTPSKTEQFPIASTTRIRQGWHKINASALQKLAGYDATVRYTDSGGTKTVESVHVFEK